MRYIYIYIYIYRRSGARILRRASAFLVGFGCRDVLQRVSNDTQTKRHG